MAKLILTDEEKATKLYTDWDNEALGAACRYMMHMLDKVEAETQKWSIASMGAAAHLIHETISNGATEADWRFGEFSIGGKKMGDWVVTAKRVGDEQKTDC